MADGTNTGSVGTIHLDLVVRDTVEKQVSDLSSKATASAKKSFSGMETAIGSIVNKAIGKVTKLGDTIVNGPARVMERAAGKMQNSTQKAFQSVSNSAASCGQKVESSIDRSFSKSVANAQAKVAELERALETVNSDLDKFAKRGITPTNNKEANALFAEQERLYERLEAAKKRLSIENQAAAEKQAAVEQAAAQKAVAAEEKAASRRKAIHAGMWKNMLSHAGNVSKLIAGKVMGVAKSITSNTGKAIKSVLRATSGLIKRFNMAGKSAGHFGTRLKGNVINLRIPFQSVKIGQQ